MSIRTSVGQSLLEDGYAAGKAAASESLRGLQDHRADLFLVFGTAGYDQEALLAGVRSADESARIVGCSGEGIISPGQSCEDEYAVAVLAFQSDTLSFEAHLIEGYSEDPIASAELLARRIGSQPTVGVIVLPDGLAGECSDFLAHLNALLPGHTVVGGTAADSMRFAKTYQYLGTRVVSGAVAALVLRGEGRLISKVSHGCTPIGRARRLTRAEGSWVYEIDGHPAWSVYKEYLDGDPDDLNADGMVHLCLGTYLDDSADAKAFVTRTAMALQKETGALFFPGGGLKTGQRVHFTRRDLDQVRLGAQTCARELIEAGPGKRPAAILQFDCAGRGRIVFGAAAEGEVIQPMQEEVEAGVPWLGFRTYGEIAPVEGRPRFHNYTVALCALYDRAA